jgi:HEAT repeat protein
MSTREEILALMQGDEFGGLPDLLAKREEAVPALLEILADRSLASFLRHRAAVALGESRSRAAVPGIEAALADEDPVLRLMAARALAKLAGPDASGALAALTEDPDPSVAKVALQGLAAVGNEEALAVLEKMRAEAPHDFLQTEAESAILAIRERTSKPPGEV